MFGLADRVGAGAGKPVVAVLLFRYYTHYEEVITESPFKREGIPPRGKSALRIIISGISACLAACAGTGSIAPTENDFNTVLDPGPPASSSAVRVAPPEPMADRKSADQKTAALDTVSQSLVPTPVSDKQPVSARTTVRNADDGSVPPPAQADHQALPGSIGAVTPESAFPHSERARPSAEVTYGQQEDESVFLRTAYQGGELFTLGSSFTRNKQVDDFDTPLDEDTGYWQMKMSSMAGGPGPGIEAEFAQSSFDPDTSEGFGASENRLIKLSTNSAWQGFSVGVGYQSVGENFEFGGETATGRKKNNNSPQKKLHKGRQGTEAWVSRQFGNLGVKTLASVYQDNSEGDENVPHFTTHKVGSSLNYTISSWPSAGVTLDYGNGVRGSSNEPDGVRSMEVSVENIASSLYYSDESWSGTFYVENATGEGTTSIANLRTYWLGGSYFPISTFSITPSVSYVEEEYPEFDVSTDSFATSMTVSYKPSTNSRFNFSGYSEYSTEKNRDWTMDSEYMYSSLGINWDSKKPKSLIKKLSLELFHDQYTDNMYSDNNTGGVGFMLKLRSKTSPLRRITEEVR